MTKVEVGCQHKLSPKPENLPVKTKTAGMAGCFQNGTPLVMGADGAKADCLGGGRQQFSTLSNGFALLCAHAGADEVVEGAQGGSSASTH